MNVQTHVLLVGPTRADDDLVSIEVANSESFNRLPVFQHEMTLAEYCREQGFAFRRAGALQHINRALSSTLHLFSDGLYQEQRLWTDLCIFTRHEHIAVDQDRHAEVQFGEGMLDRRQREMRLCA